MPPTSSMTVADYGDDSLALRPRQRSGSLLLEAVVAIAIFAIFLGGVGMTLMIGERTTITGGDRATASFIAERALEGLRAMALADFTSLTVGTHGVSLSPEGQWVLGDTPVTIGNGFVSEVTITQLTDEWLGATSRVSWNFGQTRSGSILLRSYLTHWRQVANLGDWSSVTRLSMTDAPTQAHFRSIALSGTFAFIAGNESTLAAVPRSSFDRLRQTLLSWISPAAFAEYTGAGLYVYDVSNPQYPTRVASGFSLGYGAYDLSIHNSRLYIMTADPGQELKIIDISVPSAPVVIGGFDVPGNAVARSVAYFPNTMFFGSTGSVGPARFASLIPSAHAQSGGTNGDTVYVGTNDNVLYSILVRDDATTTQLDSLDVGGSIHDISLSNGFAYLATSADVGELLVVDIFDPRNLIFYDPVVTGVDLEGTEDGTAVLATLTGGLIARSGSTQFGHTELSLYSIVDPVPPVGTPPLGTIDLLKDQTTAASVNELSVTLDERYAFVASNTSAAQLLVLDLWKTPFGPSSIVYRFSAGETMADASYHSYDNRLYAVSDTHFYIFASN